MRDSVHTNGIERFWASLKRAYMRVYHHTNAKHTQRRVNEIVGRCNADTINMIVHIVTEMEGKGLRYRELAA